MTTSLNPHADGHGCYVGFALPAQMHQALVALGATDDSSHLTLVYLGRRGELDPASLSALVEQCANVARAHRPLEIHVTGVGYFASRLAGIQAVHLALIDSVGLGELRADLNRAIQQVCKIPNHHGFLPHATLRYVARDEPLPAPCLADPLPSCTVTELLVELADHRTLLPLGA